MTEEESNETQEAAPEFVAPQRWPHRRINQVSALRANGIPFQASVWVPTEEVPEIPAGEVSYFKFVRIELLMAFDGADNPLFSIDPRFCLVAYGPCTEEEEDRENRPPAPTGPKLANVEEVAIYEEIQELASNAPNAMAFNARLAAKIQSARARVTRDLDS